ncbi:MAG: tail fiber domain-containing protein [Bacteroidota bacterium]
MFVQLNYGQATVNQSNGIVNTTINNPTGIQADEAFRFRSGNVRQLDAGSSFTFNNSRWFSLGRVNTGSQSVYGLRFQLPNKSAIFGYQDINDVNPKIQWVGTGSSLGDLEFRVADSFTSTNSSLVATMNNEGKTQFGRVRNVANPLQPPLAKVEIDNSNNPNDSRAYGLRINSDNAATNTVTAWGMFVTTQSASSINRGASFTTKGGTSSIGLDLTTDGNTNSTGIKSQVNTGTSDRIGILGRTLGSGTFTAAIHGELSFPATNSFAGYFDGDVFTTGSYLPSDEKLKENVSEELTALEKIKSLRPVTYNYRKITELNLSEKKQHGFIAQELTEVYPELTLDITKPVFNKEGERISYFSFKAVNYEGLIPILTSAIKELNGELLQLKEELALLKRGGSSEDVSSNSTLENVRGNTLEQNVPNPFSNQTTIKYELQSLNRNTGLMIFDMTGKIIRELPIRSKSGEITINASQIGKGMFIYAIVENGQELISKRMIIK